MSFRYDEVLCPDCGGKMISRKSQFGVFWGCASFPKCTGTRDSNGLSKLERAVARASKDGEAYEHDDKDVMNKFSFKRTR